MPDRTFSEVQHLTKGYEDLVTFALDDRDEENAIVAWATFFGSLYIHALDSEERELQAILEEAARIALIVAPRGGGKTTFLLHGLLEYKKRGGQFYLFDFKAQGDAVDDLTENWPLNLPSLQTILKEDLYARYIGDDVHEGDRFVETALDMFYPRDKARLARDLASSLDVDLAHDSLLDVFAERPDIANEQEEFVFGKLSFGAMVQVVMKLKGIDRFVVCFDNVDRLAAEIQPFLLSLAIDVYHRGRGAFGTVVALREKNVLRYTEDGADGDVVEVLTPTGHPELAYRVDIHAPVDEFVEGLLSTRQGYARDVFLTERCRDVDQDFKIILDGARKLANSSFISQRLFNLANHSRRQLLLLNAGFTKFLIRLVYEREVGYSESGLDLSQIDCRSYLYRWIYAAMNPRHEWLGDPIANYTKFDAKQLSPASACDLEWVLLAWLQRHQAKLRVGDVISGFEEIGVDRRRARDTLFSLYDCEHPDQRHVELGNVEKRLDPAEVTGGTLAYITPLGTEYIRNTVTKFEYVLQAIRFPEAVLADSTAMLRPLNHKSEDAVQRVHAHLCTMARAHAAALREFRNAMTEKAAWEETYRRDFCVGGRFVIERMVVSHLAHLSEVGGDIVAYADNLYRRLVKDFYSRAEIIADPNQLFTQSFS